MTFTPRLTRTELICDWCDIEPPWHAIFVGICCILLWLPGLELANLVPDCPIAVGEILGCFGVCSSYHAENKRGVWS